MVDQMSYNSAAANVKGRSWERIDFEINSSIQSNWGQCAATIGHTAGASNSLYVSNQLNKLSIFINPNPFSPDGDGIDDVAVISFNLPASTSRISASVYDLGAHLVRQLASNLPAVPALPTLQWNGKTDSGESLPVDRYIIFIDSLDYESGKVLSGKKVIILAQRR